MFNDKVIKQYSDGMGKTKDESEYRYSKSIIENYLRCNKQNAIQNYNKAKKIKIAQWLFFTGDNDTLIIGFVLPYLLSSYNIS